MLPASGGGGGETALNRPKGAGNVSVRLLRGSDPPAAGRDSGTGSGRELLPARGVVSEVGGGGVPGRSSPDVGAAGRRRPPPASRLRMPCRRREGLRTGSTGRSWLA